MHVDLVRAAFWPIVTARVLVVADELFLLGIIRYHRLASRLEGHDLLVDMFELSITVGVMASFLGLAIDLAAVVEAFEQFGVRLAET